MGTGKYQKKTSKKPIGLLCAAVIITVVSCGVAFGLNNRDDSAVNKEIKANLPQETIFSEARLENAIPTSSISEVKLPDLSAPSLEPICATYVSTVTAEYGSRSAQSRMTLESGANQKEVFRKQFDLGSNKTRVISARMEEVNNSIYLKIEVNDMEDGFAFKSKTFSVMSPQMKNKCYIIAKRDRIIVVEKTEKNSGWYDGYSYLAYDPRISHSSLRDNWIYSEHISVYDITESLDKVLNIEREIDPDPETKMCKIKQGKNSWIYASGFSSVTSENTVFLSTEQEFCDKANELLAQYVGSTINCTRTSWKNRWYRMEIDESEMPNNMFKVYAVSTYGILDSEDTVTSEIEFSFNVIEPDHGELTEEAPDVAVVYTESQATTEPVYWPSYIPESVDKSQLQNLIDFNLDGFWHSTDSRHVYHINTQYYSLSPLHYIDLEGSDEVKSGNVVQTSSFGLTLKAGGDRGAKFEVVAANDQLISDEITLLRTEDYVVNRLLGTWSNEDWSFTFESDGTYQVSRTQGDSYWGYYFVVDDSRIVLTKTVHDCKLREYRIEGNKLRIDNWDALIR